MAMIGAGRRELAELVTNHVLADEHRYVLMTVVDAEGQADELRQDRRAPTPDLEYFATARARLLGLAQNKAVDERTFPDRTSHCQLLRLLTSSCAHDGCAR